MISPRHAIARLLEISHAHKTLLRWRAWCDWHHGEPELKMLPRLVDPGRTAIDIGAADGVYSYYMRKLTQRCIAFEPNPVSFQKLQRNLPNVDVRNAALSDTVGTAKLRVPVVNNVPYRGWATIEPNNTLSELEPNQIRSIEVPMLRGDDLDLGDVGFIKIDVEGHELSVLRGLQKTIKRCRPVLLIEVSASERGHSFDQIKSILGGYNASAQQLSSTQNVIFRPR